MAAWYKVWPSGGRYVLALPGPAPVVHLRIQVNLVAGVVPDLHGEQRVVVQGELEAAALVVEGPGQVAATA